MNNLIDWPPSYAREQQEAMKAMIDDMPNWQRQRLAGLRNAGPQYAGFDVAGNACQYKPPKPVRLRDDVQ